MRREEIGGNTSRCAMNFNNLKSGLLAAKRCIAKSANQIMNLLNGESSGQAGSHLIPGLISDRGRTDYIFTSYERSIPAGMGNLHTRNSSMHLDGFSQQSQSGNKLVLVCPQTTGSHRYRNTVIHKNQTGSTLCGFRIGLDLTVGYSAVRIPQICSHGIADNPVLESHRPDFSFGKQMRIIRIGHVYNLLSELLIFLKL